MQWFSTCYNSLHYWKCCLCVTIHSTSWPLFFWLATMIHHHDPQFVIKLHIHVPQLFTIPIHDPLLTIHIHNRALVEPWPRSTTMIQFLWAHIHDPRPCSKFGEALVAPPCPWSMSVIHVPCSHNQSQHNHDHWSGPLPGPIQYPNHCCAWRSYTAIMELCISCLQYASPDCSNQLFSLCRPSPWQWPWLILSHRC